MNSIMEGVICPSAQAAGGQDENEVAVVALVTTKISKLDGRAARERLRTGIDWLDDPITRIIGKALPNQLPFWNIGGRTQWLISVLMLIAHLGILSLLVARWAEPTWWNLVTAPVILIGLVSLTGLFRVQVVSFAHEFVHAAGAKNPSQFDVWASRVSSALGVGPNTQDYEDEHVGGHHRKSIFATKTDPDAGFIFRLGFRPGMSRRDLYGQLWRTVFSPAFHARMIYGRLRSALITASWTHRTIVVTWLAALGLVGSMTQWWVFMTVVVLPIGPLYNISTLLQLLTEHRWMVTKVGVSGPHDYASRCIGRFCLADPPPAGLSALVAFKAWVTWGFKMLPRLLVRFGVWVGENGAHDLHHVGALVGYAPSDWPKAAFERERVIQQGDIYGLAMREAYSLREALDWVFDGLATAEQ